MTETTDSPNWPAPDVSDALRVDNDFDLPIAESELSSQVSYILTITKEQALFLVNESERLYAQRMVQRFSELRVAERLKRTNPFLLRIRGATQVRDWAKLQIESALYASEEEAVGHLLEMIAKSCFPGAAHPTYPDDFDFEVRFSPDVVRGYQVKMSWDCMPMSTRKNLSATIRSVRDEFAKRNVVFEGYFAPCYGKAKTTQPPGQEYISLSSKEFWELVGGGVKDYDVKVGEVCALLCAQSRGRLLESLVPDLLERLTEAAMPEIGDPDGCINYTKLFRRVNR
jgi:hypothetical protein